MKKVLLTICVVLVAVSIWVLFSYLNWRSNKVLQLQADSHVLETRVGPIEYRQWGNSGPIFLFFHGTPGGYDQFRPFAYPGRPELRTLAVSRPGYLRTPIETGEPLEAQAEAYAAMLDALDINEVVVMGVSGGGPAAISFASEYPERTLGLILGQAVSQPIGPGCIDDNVIFLDRVLQNDFFSWIMLSLTQRNPGILVNSLIQNESNRSRILDNSEQAGRFVRLTESVQLPTLRRAGVTNDACNNAEFDLADYNIEVPTLLLHGTEDTNVPYAFVEEFLESVPHADLITIEGGDHYITYTHPEEYYKAIDEFVFRL